MDQIPAVSGVRGGGNSNGGNPDPLADFESTTTILTQMAAEADGYGCGDSIARLAEAVAKVDRPNIREQGTELSFCDGMGCEPPLCDQASRIADNLLDRRDADQARDELLRLRNADLHVWRQRNPVSVVATGDGFTFYYGAGIEPHYAANLIGLPESHVRALIREYPELLDKLRDQDLALCGLGDLIPRPDQAAQWWADPPDLDNLPSPPPALLARDDGATVIPSDRSVSIYAPPERGKTWIGLLVCLSTIRQGGRAVSVDYEMDPRDTFLRLRLLGGYEQARDPDLFRYVYGPDMPAETVETAAQWAAERPGSVAVIDSVNRAGGYSTHPDRIPANGRTSKCSTVPP